MLPREQRALKHITSTADARALVKIYRGMADRIETKGWSQHAPVGPSGEMDITQALIEATSALTNEGGSVLRRWFRLEYESDPLVPLAYHVLAAWIDGYYPTVWNDMPERTAEEVIETLRGLANFLVDRIDSGYGDSDAVPSAEVAEGQ